MPLWPTSQQRPSHRHYSRQPLLCHTSAAEPPQPPAAGPSARPQPAAGKISLSGIQFAVQQLQCCLLSHPMDDRGSAFLSAQGEILGGLTFLTAVIADAGYEGRSRTSAGQRPLLPDPMRSPDVRRQRPSAFSSCCDRHRRSPPHLELKQASRMKV